MEFNLPYWCRNCDKFQSRNRESFGFYKWHRQHKCYCCLFQSRNRESFGFYQTEIQIENGYTKQCFNLVIESLLVSTKPYVKSGKVFIKCFNLVIESLLVSTHDWISDLMGTTVYRFNLVIESLLVSTSDEAVLPDTPPDEFESRNRGSFGFYLPTSF